jgi:uncharacterized protein YjiS (DUF1127 family)
MSQVHACHKSYSFVKCQLVPYLRVSSKGAQIMFARVIALLQLRRSTAFLLRRNDDHLIADIGLTRAELEVMHLGLDRSRLQASIIAFPSGQALPVLLRA